MNLRTLIFITSLPFLFFSCKEEQKHPDLIRHIPILEQNVHLAEGFKITTCQDYKEIKVFSPWPEATDTLTYILYPRDAAKPLIKNKKAKFIEIPIRSVVVTSTTDIPLLEYLDIDDKLKGFPNTDYISSEQTRKRIDSGKIKDLGNDIALNTEILLELQPDLVIGFSSSGDTKGLDLVDQLGIPVVMNGSWLEKHPLGRAEWIKFVAAFFNKEKEAKEIFQNIEQEYNEAKKLTDSVSDSPTVLSGTMFKDIWYVPGGESYVAQFLKDAKTNYLWKENKQTGSLSLSFESVLEKAQNAELWIGAGSANSLEDLEKQNNRYVLFNAFKNKNVYSPTLKTGAKGGMMYYELGPMRPDFILKDIIKITHPEVLPEYELYFFEKLK